MAEKPKFSCSKTLIDSQLLKIIKQTEDSVKPETIGWRLSFNTEIWLFRPGWCNFLIITSLFVITWLIRLYAKPLCYDEKLLITLLTLIVPIFVIGISITTLAHRLGESGDFTAEYLNEACRLPVFACQSFLSILFAVTALALPSGHFLDNSKGLLTYATLGSTLAITPSFLFIILTLIRCSNPKEAIKATTKFSTTWLENAFTKDAYHKISKELPANEQNIIKNKYKPPPDEEWENHLVKVQNAFGKAVEARSLEQIQEWLACTIEPIHRVFRICKEVLSYQQSTDYDPSRLYKMVQIYELVFNQLLVLDKRENLWFVERGTFLIVKAVLKEVRQLFGNENYYCLRPLCWVVAGLYAQLLRSEYSQALHRQRAYFGNFYASPHSLFEELPTNCTAETKSIFRQILHEGLTLWLLTVIKEKDNELVEPLCEAGRKLVFADETVDLKTDKALLQHLVLAGKLISDRLTDKTDVVSAKSLEMLFSDSHRSLPLGLSDLATTYKKSYPTIATDLYRFVEQLGDAWEKTDYNPLTGSGGYTGTRFHGGLEHFTTGFLYAAALIMEHSVKPDPIPLDITRVKTQLQKIQENHTKLENNSVNVLGTYLGRLDGWIDVCAKKKAQQDK